MAEHTAAAPLRPAILLLGAGHWSNPGLDYVSVRYDDMLAPHRQREIAEVIERLARAHPTKVALEVVPAQAETLNDAYRRYRAGAFALTANERHQLGFRLAARLGHDRVYAVDLPGEIGWERAIAFARQHRQLHRLDDSWTGVRAPGTDAAADASARIARTSVLDLLRGANDPATFAASHAPYLQVAMIGEGDEYVGAEVVLNWYARNLKIVVNLSRFVTSSQDRVLVIIGSGHLPLLTHFLQATDQFSLDPITPFLC